MTSPFDIAEPEKLAVFVQEYVRHEGQEDCAVIAVIRSQLRDPRYSPSLMAERVLAKPEIQAAIKAARSFYIKPEGVEVTQATLLSDFEDIYQKSIDDRQYQSAIAAKRNQADLLGLNKNVVDVNVTHTLTMSDAQLEKIASRAPIDAEFHEVSGLPAIT